MIECVGRPDTVSTGVRPLRPGGRLVVLGVGMKPPRIDLPLTLFCVGELGVLGSFASHGEDLAEVLRREAAGLFAIEAAISHRLPLVRVADGVETFRAKAGDPQRTVIEMPV